MDTTIPQPITSAQPLKIRNCPSCGQPREIKSPWKELFRKPTMNEVIIMFMMIMVLVIAWAYKHDIAICKDFVKNIDKVCISRSVVYGGSSNSSNTNLNKYDYANITLPNLSTVDGS